MYNRLPAVAKDTHLSDIAACTTEGRENDVGAGTGTHTWIRNRKYLYLLPIRLCENPIEHRAEVEMS